LPPDRRDYRNDVNGGVSGVSGVGGVGGVGGVAGVSGVGGVGGVAGVSGVGGVGGVAGLRVAYCPALGGAATDPAVRTVTDAAAQRFTGLGAHVEETDPRVPDPLETFTALWYAGAANALRHLGDGERALLDPGLAEIVAEGGKLSALEYLAAADRRGEFGIRLGRFHESYDLLLTPAVGVPPFAAGREVPDGWPAERWPTWARFSLPFNLSQQPAATVPCGFTPDGLPVGLQVVGPKYADALVLRAALAYERANPLYDRLPPRPGEVRA
ncbi:MAG: amidase family protein, partial [Actinomycetota bacterium]